MDTAIADEPMNSIKPKVWIVEDDEDLREELVRGLGERGLTAIGFPDGMSLYQALMTQPCDVVVLDIALPDEDGLSIARRLRSGTELGIVMLTARGQTEDRVRALLDGADAYLVKPVELAELDATIRSVYRRIAPANTSVPDGAAAGQDWQLTHGGWVLQSPTRVSIPLSHSERVILGLLLERRNMICTRTDLINALGYRPDSYQANRLDMLFTRLRRKIGAETGLPLPVKAVRGQGFTFT